MVDNYGIDFLRIYDHRDLATNCIYMKWETKRARIGPIGKVGD